MSPVGLGITVKHLLVLLPLTTGIDLIGDLVGHLAQVVVIFQRQGEVGVAPPSDPALAPRDAAGRARDFCPGFGCILGQSFGEFGAVG